jgi:acetyl-CoA carboxylase biotin carboxyl carrier protein
MWRAWIMRNEETGIYEGSGDGDSKDIGNIEDTGNNEESRMMDEELIFSLIDRFEKSSLTSLLYDDGDEKIVLKRGGPVVSGVAAPQTVPPAVQPHVQQTAQPGEAAPEGRASPGPDVITSPIVATFYASNVPDAPPFVQAGDKVKKGQTLCILEAMKMMNKLDAETDCEILAVKAKPGDLVEFGQVLFEIKKR